MNKADPQFFLVGSVRSGTTLLRLLLGHHPQVCKCEEMEYFAEYRREHGGQPDLQAYHDYLRHDRGFRLDGYSVDPALSFTDLMRSFFAQRQQMDDKPLVGATVHNAFAELGAEFPEAKYIFLVRDPRDVARSCVQMGWVGSAWSGSQFWLDAQSEWQRLGQHVPSCRRLIVRFEDLVSSTEEELERICAFLGVAFHPDMLQIEGDTSYKRPDPRQARSWRDTASQEEVTQVEARIGAEAIVASGYAVSDYPSKHYSALQKLRIRCQDLATRSAFRLRRYGFSLWFSSILLRRLPLAALEQRVRLAMDEIDNQHLK